MPFLLLLSALLTALTGAVVGVRPLEISAQHESLPADVRHVAVVAVPPVVGHRHLLGGFGDRAVFALAATAPAMPTAAPRLYLDRPRV